MRTKRVAVIVSIMLLGAGLVMGQTVWEQYSGNPVMGPGEPGEWDELGPSLSAAMFDGTTYHLWFTSYGPDGLPTDIGHATSPDGIAWTMDPANPVLTRGAPGGWDGAALRRAAVIHDGTQFHMWYEGWDADLISRVGYATSPDGSVWSEYLGNPVMDAGASGEWDDWGPEPSSVIVDANGYKMWYSSSSTSGDPGGRVGYAESADGITWTKHQGPVLEPSTEGWDSGSLWHPMVIFDGSAFHMWYTGRDVAFGDFEDGASIGYASSADGLAWTRYSGNPVVEASTWYAYNPTVVFDGSMFRMWYSYWDGAVDWVGYATSDSAGTMRFIPAAAVASGAEGAFFQTDVDVNNADGQMATYQFMWLPRGEDNSDPLTSETFGLGAGMSVRYDNVLTSVFGLEPDALGALAIVASSPDLLAMSRTYNQERQAAGRGTYGQAIPAVPEEGFIQFGDRQRILFASEHSDLRTNVGCQNGSNTTTVVKIELFDAGGTSLEIRQMTLSPLSNNQYNRLFEDYRPVNGYVDVWTDTAEGSFYCYGSVLDNVTSDPTTILPQ